MAAKNTVSFLVPDSDQGGRRESVFSTHPDKLREENSRLQRDLERSLQERNRLLKKMNQSSSVMRPSGGSRVLEKHLEQTRSELDALTKERQQLIDKSRFLSQRLAEAERIPVAFLARIEELASLSDPKSAGHSDLPDSDMLSTGQVCERFNGAVELMWRSLEQNSVFQKEALVDWVEKLRVSLDKKRDEARVLKQENHRLAEESSDLEMSLQQTAADSALKDQRLGDIQTRLEELEIEKGKITKNNLQLKSFIKDLRAAVDPDVFRYIVEYPGTLRQVEDQVSEVLRAKPLLVGAMIGVLSTLFGVWLFGAPLEEPEPATSADASLEQRTEWLATGEVAPAVAAADFRTKANHPETAGPAAEVSWDFLRSGGRGPALIELPGGSFSMGTDRYGAPEIERPARLVQLKPFRISRTEVTFADYDAFAQATSRTLPGDQGWGRGQRPVVGVNWQDAHAYAQWLSKQTGKTYRLPSEAEWEYAFGGGFQGIYWWGNHFESGREVCFNCGTRWDGHSTAPVGSAQANRFGLHDMGGNVMEWVGNCLDTPSQPGACVNRVVRGADFNKPASSLRTTARRGLNADSRLPVLGFRLVREL